MKRINDCIGNGLINLFYKGVEMSAQNGKLAVLVFRVIRYLYSACPQIVETVYPQLQSLCVNLINLNNQLFVSKYQLALPRREEIEQFLADKLCEAGGI